ncbi:MAG: hypothetical protein IJY92_03325 [Alphaproteobacteria bacterium]|nr:hypothetical protein [Alphaproteobacteria bacterium]
MVTQLSLFLAEAFLVFGCVKWIIPFWQSKTDKDVSVASFLKWFALFSGGVVLAGISLNGFIEKTPILVSAALVMLATVGGFFYTQIQEKKYAQIILTSLFCGVGLFLTPFSFEMSVTAFAYKGLALVLWVAFIYMMQQFDRIFLFSFSVFSVLFLTASLMTSSVFPLLPIGFQFLCLSILVVLGMMTFLWKKIGIFLQGSSFVFFMAYIIGYFGYYLATTGEGSALPIFIAYELLEITIALGANFYLYRKLTPIEVPFLIEKALMTGKEVGKVIKKIFSISFFFAMLALISAYILRKDISVMGIKNIQVMYLFAGILLFQVYLVLTSWGQPKVEFKNLFKDIKSEIKKAKKRLHDPKKSSSKKEK